MTVFTPERLIQVDGRVWLIRAVRNQASCWGQARAATDNGWIEVDLTRVDPDDTAYDLQDAQLLDVVARAAPTAIRTALRRRAIGQTVQMSVGL